MDMRINALSRAVVSKEQQNRSVNRFTGVLRGIVTSAANRIETSTVLKEPFPYVQQCEDIWDKVCRDVEREHAWDHLRHIKTDRYVS